MNMMLLLVIYAVAIVGYVVFSRRRQARLKIRFAGLAKGAEVETIGGLIAIVDKLIKKIIVSSWMRKVFS